MACPPTIDEAHAEALLAMAEHFLDTETRHRLPHTAHVCLLAGLDRTSLRSAWCEDVGPVVGMNLITPAGEWVGWDREWLLQRIRARRARERWWLGRWRNRWERRLQPGSEAELEAVTRFMAVLRDASNASSRDQRLADLLWLGRCFFAMPADASVPSPADRLRLLHGCEAPFRSAIAPVLLEGESVLGEQRIRSALAATG